MYKTLLFSIFFMLSILGYSQKMITGKVVIDNIDEGVDLQGVLVNNLSTDAKILTNSNGFFSIKVNLNDVLEFSNGFIEKRTIKISENILMKVYLEVHLNFETIELETANLNTLNKDFKSNIRNEDSQSTKNYNSWGLDPNLQYIEVNPNMTSSINNNGFLDPALWMSKLSGKYKKDKKQNEYFLFVSTKNEIIDHFTPNYFIEKLKIPEHKIQEFMNYCASKSNIINLFKNLEYEAVENHLIQNSYSYNSLIKQNQN